MQYYMHIAMTLSYTFAAAGGRTSCDNIAAPIGIFSTLAAAWSKLLLSLAVCSLFPAHCTYHIILLHLIWPQALEHTFELLD